MDDHIFSSVDFIGQCLIDKKRTDAFESAVEQIVKEGDMVLDMGTGSGVMALFAARNKAKKVVAVEIDSYVAKIAESNTSRNGYENIIKIINTDARFLSLDEEIGNNIVFDVVIMEMLTTGMIDEYQIQAINNLHTKGYVNKKTIFVPGIQKTYIEFAETDYKQWGNLDIRMPIHAWNWTPEGYLNYKVLSEKKLIDTTNFSEPSKESVSKDINAQVEKKGTVNSVIVSSQSILTKNNILGDTMALNAPVIIPLETELSVNESDSIKAQISYKFGMGYQTFKAEINN